MFILRVIILNTNNLEQKHSIKSGKATYTVGSEKYGPSFYIYFSCAGTPSIPLPHEGGIKSDLQAVQHNCMLLWRHKKKKMRYSQARRSPSQISSRINILERPAILKKSYSMPAQGNTHKYSKQTFLLRTPAKTRYISFWHSKQMDRFYATAVSTSS